MTTYEKISQKQKQIDQLEREYEARRQELWMELLELRCEQERERE